MRKLLLLTSILVACKSEPVKVNNKATLFFAIVAPKSTCWSIEDTSYPHTAYCRSGVDVFYCKAWSMFPPECRKIAEVLGEGPKAETPK